jgi:hypothetical protein
MGSLQAPISTAPHRHRAMWFGFVFVTSTLLEISGDHSLAERFFTLLPAAQAIRPLKERNVTRLSRNQKLL